MTIGCIAKAIGDIQLGIQREQQWKTGGKARVDVLLTAGVPPTPAKANVAIPIATQRQSRRWCRKRPNARLQNA